MTLVCIAVLELKICLIDIGAQKIDESTLSIYKMVLASFQIEDKKERLCFFQKTLLLADTIIKMILKMLFLVFSKIKINFAA